MNDPASFGGLRSALSIPLEAHEQIVGVLSLYSLQADAFSPDHLRRLLSLGATLAAALSLTRAQPPLV